MSIHRWIPVFVLSGLFGSAPPLRCVNAADPALRATLEDANALDEKWWIYNDLTAARAEALADNKPLFVTFRCVPCKDCAAFDAEVANGSEVVERLAREHFVPVRQVEMKGVDLSQFQFDYDLNWAAMFINADGTVYARYGTQSAAGPDAYNSIAGLEATMRRVLALHAGYPANADLLRDKRGADKAYATALDMPGLEDKERLRAATTRDNCIHCHNIHDAENQQAYDVGEFTRDRFWRYPLPDNIGLTIDADSGVRIAAVAPESPAARAGIRAGEEVTRMNGQAITSIADMQWVLDDLPNAESEVRMTTSESGAHAVSLAPGWKEHDFSWRGSLWSMPPEVNVWMPTLDADQQQQLGIPADRSPLDVRWINLQQPGGRAAHEGGLREGDVIVALDGEPLVAMTHARFAMQIKLRYRPGDELPLTVLRDGREQSIRIKLVR